MPDRKSIKDWFRHAFAVDNEPLQPTPEQQIVVDRLCREIVRRHLTVPALAFLEMSRPMNFLGAQALHFFMPLINALTVAEAPRHFAEFLEHRGATEVLCRRIEELAAEESQRDDS